MTPAGTKSWRWRVQQDGREIVKTLGHYPAMGIAEARRAREAAATAPRTVPTFEAAARQWHELNKPRWKPHHAADVLAALRTLEQRGAVETARRVKQRCSAVFGFSIGAGWCVLDPTSGLQAALAPLPAKGRRPAVLTLKDARALIRHLMP
ncbi:MAG: hypothetical protein RQ966_15950 [Acetobacteraceae bacterium]|nr:hypothetical protein [Acetobacteraceae bacterium]